MNEENKNEPETNDNIQNTQNYEAPATEPDRAVESDTLVESEVPVDTEQTTDPASVVDTVESVEPDTTYAVPAAPVTKPLAATPKKDNKKLLLAVAATVVVVVTGIAAWWFMTSGGETDAQDSSAVSSEPATLGVSVTVVDGTVEYSRGGEWQSLTSSSDVQLAEGDLVRTAADSRTVLTLDDGSAVRLDEKTEVKLVSLDATDVRVEHSEGSVYSRVVASDRKYTVTVDEVSYEALGTAFVTVNSGKNSGLQVFQSSVQPSGSDTAVAEGQQYFVANANAALVNKVTNFEIAKLVNDDFVAWNVAEDKKDDKFKENLGVLSGYDEAVAKEKARLKAETEAKRAAEKAAQEAAEKARLEAERKAREPANTSTSAMSVKFSDGGIFWTYSGTASNGFKVVYSATNTTPSFGQSGTTSVYVSEPRAQYLGLPKEMKAGKTYYVRVCAYQPDNTSQPCRDYSNVLQFTRT